MKLEACILTSPRPTSTFYETLHSMKAAGFIMPHVMDGLPGGGVSSSRNASLATLEIMSQVVERYPFDMLLIVNDDVIFSLYTYKYLCEMVYPHSDSSLYSIYTPSGYSTSHKVGVTWNLERKNHLLVGGIAYIYPRSVVKRILLTMDPKTVQYGFDREIGGWARDHGHKIWYHEPSLVQHIGMGGNSSLGHTFGDKIGRASTFKGDRNDYSSSSYEK